MKRLVFKATLLSDIIIHADSATEGQKKTLDFIPGSSFLGILAKDYMRFENPYDIFHSDKVRFGDAHISDGSNKSFKTPLSWFYLKGKSVESTKWVHHSLTQEIRDELTQKGKQLKQARTGWIVSKNTNEGTLMPINSNYAIKSAYDREKRTSKEGQLFGFKSLETGSEWIFYVDIDETIDESSIITGLIGKKHIGKSRSAQYGRIEIEKLDVEAQSLSSDKLFQNKYLILYAESRLVFFDAYGQPTLQPNESDFNLSADWKIDWSKSQAKSQVFAPYNFKNRSFLADRVCFDKGSVFVFEKQNDNVKYDLDHLLNVVGEFKNEGFGQVIVNPEFLTANDKAESLFKVIKPKENKEQNILFAIKEDDSTDELIINWFNNKQKTEQEESEIYKSIKSFIKDHLYKFSGISPSQWGQIRAIATSAADFDEMMAWLFENTHPSSPDGVIRSQDRAASGFLEHGKMERLWKKGKDDFKRELINKKNYGTKYAIALATQMQKKAIKQEAENEI